MATSRDCLVESCSVIVVIIIVVQDPPGGCLAQGWSGPEPDHVVSHCHVMGALVVLPTFENCVVCPSTPAFVA